MLDYEQLIVPTVCLNKWANRQGILQGKSAVDIQGTVLYELLTEFLCEEPACAVSTKVHLEFQI